jgi:hypothetical protein
MQAPVFYRDTKSDLYAVANARCAAIGWPRAREQRARVLHVTSPPLRPPVCAA